MIQSMKIKRSEQEKQLAKMASHTLNSTVVTLHGGVQYSRLTRLSKAGRMYSGICSEDGRLHKFCVIHVVEVK